MSREVNPRKAAVIGCGFVGSATAFTLMQSRLFSELVLLDVNMEKADGEAKDIAHGIPFAGQMKIYAGDSGPRRGGGEACADGSGRRSWGADDRIYPGI